MQTAESIPRKDKRSKDKPYSQCVQNTSTCAELGSLLRRQRTCSRLLSYPWEVKTLPEWVSFITFTTIIWAYNIHHRKRILIFRCCGPKKHIRTKCRETVLCSVCKATDHPSALHQDSAALATGENHEGEKPQVISSSCTQICGKPANTSKSYAKIVKAIVYPELKPNHARYLYCIIDDQSCNTLATSQFFDHVHEYSPDHRYTLKSCSGESVNSGRKARGYVIESCDRSRTFKQPDIIKCDEILHNLG